MLPSIKIFNFELSSFLLFIGLGFLAGFFFARFHLREAKLPRHFFFHTVILILSGAFVGAKIYYIVQSLDLFLKNPVGVFFSLSGTGWFGGFLLCTLLMLLYCRKKRLPFFYLADVLVPTVPLGIIFGRFGCFLAGDACYGIPTDLPWGMSFPNGAAPTLLAVHPTQLYEVLANAVIFICLIKLNKSKPKDGYVLAMYLILSSSTRFFVEFIRLSPIVWWGLTLPQIISICLFAIGTGLLLRRRHSDLFDEVNFLSIADKRRMIYQAKKMLLIR